MQRFATITIYLVLSLSLSALPLMLHSKAAPEAKAAANASDARFADQSAALKTQLAEDIKNLASAPRFTREQYERAVNYVRAQARAAGLDAETDWFEVRDPWERGNDDQCAMLSPDGSLTQLRIVALTNSVAGEVTDAEVVLVDDFRRGMKALRRRFDNGGKSCVVLFSRPLIRQRSIKGYEDTVIQRNRGASWAATYGAAAVLVRSVQTDQGVLPHVGAVSYTDKKIPAAALSVQDADRLEKLLRAGKKVRIQLKITSRHESRQQTNVVIRIPGTTLPQEIVLLGAHLDSHDLTPGAVDDAAGVAAVLAVMRRFAAHPPARTIWLVLFADEEVNSSGSIAFVEKYREQLSQPSRFIAAIEMDDGDGPPWGLQITSSPEKDGAALACLRQMAPRPDEAAVELEYRAVRSTNGADVEKLWDCYGIPEIAIMQDLTKYFDRHHATTDTPEKIDLAGLQQTTQLLDRIMRVITAADFDGLKSLRGASKLPCPDK